MADLPGRGESLMQQGQDYLAALPGSHRRVVMVHAWRGGRLVARDLPLSGGSVTITDDQSVRGTCDLRITDPGGVFTPRVDGPLSPWGSELQIRAGMQRGPIVDLFDLGRFVIQSAETDESWRPYERPAEPNVQYWVSRGATTQVPGADRLSLLQEARFITRVQPANPRVFAEIARLARGLVPWTPPDSVQDAAIPSSLTYDDDRLGAVQKLAAVVDAQPVMTAGGALTLQGIAANRPSYSVWTIPRGPNGLLVKMRRTVSRDGMHNAVVARGTAKDDRPLQAVAYDTSEPLAWGGPFGQAPLFYESPLLNTQDAVNRAAATILQRERTSRLQKIDVDCVCNYALEVGDLVTIPAPKGDLPGRVTAATWPLVGDGNMSLTLAVDPFVLAQVS